MYQQSLHVKSHLGEGKKGASLDVTPDLVDCCRQLMHLGETGQTTATGISIHLLLDVVRDALRKLHHVVFIAEYGHNHLRRNFGF